MLGIDPALLGSRRYLREVLSKLGLRDLRRVSRIVERIARAKLRSAKTIERIRSLDRDAMIETLSRLRAKARILHLEESRNPIFGWKVP